ncbi:MAG: hypothetical protein LBV67_04515 [Streptococcaceae bacterium]|jgi:hypothetical protein|nr:hypothetical protein [Streptococcaceae bacterium]
MAKKLSEIDLKNLEDQFRNKKIWKNNLARIEFFIRKKNPEASENEIKKIIGMHSGFAYYTRLVKNIEEAYEELPMDLKKIVDKYFWGEYHYLNWKEIADVEIISESTSYKRRRYPILEKLAYKKGELYDENH